MTQLCCLESHPVASRCKKNKHECFFVDSQEWELLFGMGWLFLLLSAVGCRLSAVGVDHLSPFNYLFYYKYFVVGVVVVVGCLLYLPLLSGVYRALRADGMGQLRCRAHSNSISTSRISSSAVMVKYASFSSHTSIPACVPIKTRAHAPRCVLIPPARAISYSAA